MTVLTIMCSVYITGGGPSFHKSRCKNFDTLEFKAKISKQVNGKMKTDIEFKEQQQKL